MPRHLRSAPSLLLVATIALAVAASGCGPAESAGDADSGDHGHDHDHDHGDRPESLQAAVDKLTSIRDTVRTAMLEGDANAAHGPLHEVGELLDALPDVAAETDLAEEDWNAVQAATDELRIAFAAIDKAFHTKDADKKAAYEQVADELDDAIEDIRSRLPMTGEEPAEEENEDHDHDDHDHDHDDHGDDGDAP